MGSYKERKDKNGKVVGYSAQIRIKGHRPVCGSFKLTLRKMLGIWTEAKALGVDISFGTQY
jgi:hypothetical protein